MANRCACCATRRLRVSFIATPCARNEFEAHHSHACRIELSHRVTESPSHRFFCGGTPFPFHFHTKKRSGVVPVFVIPCMSHGAAYCRSPAFAGLSFPFRLQVPVPSATMTYSSSACWCGGWICLPGLITATAARP